VAVTADNAAPGTAGATSAASAVVAVAPPHNTALPALTGTPKDGETLSSTTGSWTGTATITYVRQWLRCDGDGESCTEVPGATGTTFALAPADIGSTFRVRVTAANGGAETAVAMSASSGVVEAAPPLNTSLPAIVGLSKDGETLTSTLGSWTGTPTISLERQWLRCEASCTPIPGATDASYALISEDVGKSLRVTITADNSAPGTVSVESLPTSPVDAIPPANGAIPYISGEAREGETLVSTLGYWTGTPSIGLVPSWLRCDAAGGDCVAIGGANSQSYLLKQADVGHTMRVRVSADNPAPGKVEADSEQTLVVEPAFPNLSPPSSGDSGQSTASGGAGTTAPIVRAGKVEFRKRRGKPSLRTTVRCWTSACDVRMTAKISLPGRAGVHSLLPARLHMTIGGKATLAMQIPKSLARKISRAVSRRKRVKAVVGVYAAHTPKPVTVLSGTVKYRR
jgi:fibronectin-binding autotransporter adhesin